MSDSCRDCPTARALPGVVKRLSSVEKRLEELVAVIRELQELHTRHSKMVGDELGRITNLLQEEPT